MSRIGFSALAVGLACLAAPAWAQYTPLFVIPTQNTAGVTLPAGKAARIRITSVDASLLARSLGVEVPADASSFEYLIDAYPQLQSRAERNWLEATFMVDFDQAPFTKLKDEMKGQGVRAERAALVTFVDGLIDENFARGWDIASVIAERRQGDCSEHAVLTAALARAVGLPARVVVGVALISQGSEHAAFGHAWTEMLEGGKWVVADAALHGTEQAVRYVPLGLIEDEGVGYRMGLATLTRRWIQSVDVLEPR